MELKYVIEDHICALWGAHCGSILDQTENREFNAEETSFLNLKQDPVLGLDLELNHETQRYCYKKENRNKNSNLAHLGTRKGKIEFLVKLHGWVNTQNEKWIKMNQILIEDWI